MKILVTWMQYRVQERQWPSIQEVCNPLVTTAWVLTLDVIQRAEDSGSGVNYISHLLVLLGTNLYKAEKPSVCLSVSIFGMLITQQSLHGLKQDLFKMKSVSLKITEFILTSLQSPVYYGYLQSTMAICSQLWLPAVYYGYLQSTMAICSQLWLPAVYYGYL